MTTFPGFRATVFDLDGTLLQTLRDIGEAANRVLEQNGHPTFPIDAFREFVGDGPDVLFMRATRAESEQSPEILSLVEAYREECHRQNDRHTCLYDGLKELLDHWSHQGVSLNILTNKMQHHAEICAERFLPHWPWAKIIGSGDSIPKKPDPTGALKISEEIGVPVDQCLYLGDTNTDMETAVRAGMFAIGVTWGFRSEEELWKAGADCVIHHPSELMG